jgi:Domain of Unknown Function (DUF928)
MAILKQATSTLLIGLFLSIGLPANAAYKPRPGRRPPKGNITTPATRDNCNSQSLVIQPIAPQDHIAEFGQLPKTPLPLTIAWSMANPKSAAKLKLEVNLFRDQGQSQAFVATLAVKSLGNDRWSATLDQPLEPGRYAWKLSNCDTSITPFQELDVSALPTAASASIGKAKTPEERSQIYAESGFWHNALDEALRSDSSQPLNNRLADLQNFEPSNPKPSPCP